MKVEIIDTVSDKGPLNLNGGVMDQFKDELLQKERNKVKFGNGKLSRTVEGGCVTNLNEENVVLRIQLQDNKNGSVGEI